MDKVSIAKLQRAQCLKHKIEQIREQIGDTPIPWTCIKPKSKPKRTPKPQFALPFHEHWTSKRHLSGVQKKFIRDNTLRIRGKCAEICREIKWTESYTYPDRVRALSVIEKEIKEVILDNKRTFGYDRNVRFPEKTISQYADIMAHQLFVKAVEMGRIRFDEDLPGYVDELGMPINEYDFKLTKLCREAAKSELLEEYNASYKAGYNCDCRISIVIERCELLKNSIRVRKDFLTKTSNIDEKRLITCHLFDYLLIDNKLCLIKKLQGLPSKLPPKMYGAIITVLILEGKMRPIADGEKGAVYRALCNIYNDSRYIGTRQGVAKYICAPSLSPLDINAAKALLQ